MTTTITALRPDLEFAASGTRQVNAESQRDAWLRQMELNQLSLLQQLGQQDTGSANNGSSSAANNTHDEQEERETVRQDTQSGAGTPDTSSTASTALLPVHPIVAAAVDSDDQAPLASGVTAAIQAPTGATLATASATPPAAIATSASALSFPPTQNTGAAASQAGILPTAPTLQQKFAPNQIAARTQDDSLAASIQANASQSAYTPGQSSDDPIRQIPTAASTNPNSLASVALRTAIASTPQTREETEESDEQQPAASSETQDTASSETWQKRLIHVAQEGKNLSVSIRDSALDTQQSVQIVSRLAGDAAQSGLRLRNATVNGKALLKQSQANTSQTGNDTALTDTETSTETFTLTIDPQERTHGA